MTLSADEKDRRIAELEHQVGVLFAGIDVRNKTIVELDTYAKKQERHIALLEARIIGNMQASAVLDRAEPPINPHAALLRAIGLRCS